DDGADHAEWVRGGMVDDLRPYAFGAIDFDRRGRNVVNARHGSACVSDARVEHRVKQVDEEIDRHCDYGDKHHQVLHNWIVAPADGLYEKTRNARNVKHRLGYDETAH